MEAADKKTTRGATRGGVRGRPQVPGAAWLLALAAAALVAACGGGSGGGGPPPSSAATSDVFVLGHEQGVTPFIHFVTLRGASLAALSALRYTIAPKPGAASRAVDVTFGADTLSARGYLTPQKDRLTLPVFGLYAGHTNRVTLEIRFADGSQQSLPVDVAAPPYADPNAIYDRPTVRVRRAAGSGLGYDYFFIKSQLGGLVIVDTDGEMRWVGPAIGDAISSTFRDNAFWIGAQNSTAFLRLELDGTLRVASLIPATRYTNFHHNVDAGKIGLLGEFDAVQNIESILAEFTDSGAVVAEWDFAALLGDYMRSQGDDPAAFIRPGIDWFHMNAATYDPRDDSVIVSSRENFVIKVDYRTGRVVWILGDPTKYWYTFPSLRARALTLQAGGLYPIGQHSTSLTAAGELMVFNNGLFSLNQPAGAPQGENRNFSAVSAYVIDPQAMTAREAWRFDQNQTILSAFCSSVYEGPGASLLVNYAVVDNATRVRIVGVDAARNVVFDFEYPTTGCRTSWNSMPVPLDAMRYP